MEKYKNYSGDSGVTYYLIGRNFIDVSFKNKPGTYRYSNTLNGEHHISKMKTLALKGKGLATYISQHPEVKNYFDKR